jgi:hypothetical protein
MSRKLESVLLMTLLSATVAPGAEKAEVLKEYYTRLKEIAPRSAGAHVELAEWCKAAGLESEATQAYEQAIAIDEDCEAARAALGYRRHGTGWRKPGQAAAPRPARSAPAEAAPAARSAAGTAAPKGGEAAPAADAQPATTAASPAAPAAEPEAAEGPTPEPEATTKAPAAAKAAGAFEAAVEKKKAWAKVAADKLGTTFSVYEDADFLVHSTLPAASREMKSLTGHLKQLKKLLAAMLGGGASARPWPDKLHLVLVKSEPEFERFAEIVDGARAAKSPDGAYTSEDHTVLWIPESAALPRLVGETALRKLNGSDREVGWWLEKGIAELLYAQSPAGQKENYYAQTMKYAADIIQSEGDNLKIFNVIETRGYKKQDASKNEALAFSLVDFLIRQKGAFQRTIKSLKSEKAPAPPGENGDEAAYQLSYISFQEETLNSAYGTTVSALGEKWKAYVLTVAEKLKASTEEKEKKKEKKEKKTTPPKGKGADQGGRGEGKEKRQ